jgi:hypothetical protein
MTSFALQYDALTSTNTNRDDGVFGMVARVMHALAPVFAHTSQMPTTPPDPNDVLLETALFHSLLNNDEKRRRAQKGLPELGGLRAQWAGPNRPANTNDRIAEIILEKKLGPQSLQMILNHVRRMGLGRSTWDIFVKDWMNNGGKTTRPTHADLLLALEG